MPKSKSYLLNENTEKSIHISNADKSSQSLNDTSMNNSEQDDVIHDFNTNNSPVKSFNRQNTQVI